VDGFHSNQGENIFAKVESSDAENNGGKFKNETSIKHEYRDDTWKQEHFTYDTKLQDFVRVLESNLVWY
jgi:hypothetical protein